MYRLTDETGTFASRVLPNSIATDGGWGSGSNGAETEVVEGPPPTEGWHHPMYDASHSGANPLAPVSGALDSSRESWKRVSNTPSTSVTRPVVTAEYIAVGCDTDVLIYSIGDGRSASYSLNAAVAGLCWDSSNDIIVALSEPLYDSESSGNRDQKEGTADAAVTPTERSIDTSDSDEDDGTGEERDNNSSGETKEVEDELGTEQIRDQVVSQNYATAQYQDAWVEVCAIDPCDEGILWRRYSVLGNDTMDGLRFPVAANNRYYLPSTPLITAGGAGRDTGEIGGLDPFSGDEGGYISYPYQDFNATPRGPPIVDSTDTFYFHAGGQAGELLKIGTVLSRPAWQTYIGPPRETTWQGLLSQGVLVLPGNRGRIVGVDAKSGDVLWSKDGLGEPNDAARAAAHGGFFLQTGPSEVTCLNSETGTEQWRTEVGDGDVNGNITSIVVGANVVYVGHGPNCHALDAASGAQFWTETAFRSGTEVKHLAVTSQGLCVVGDDGSLGWAWLRETERDYHISFETDSPPHTSDNSATKAPNGRDSQDTEDRPIERKKNKEGIDKQTIRESGDVGKDAEAQSLGSPELAEDENSDPQDETDDFEADDQKPNDSTKNADSY